MKKIIIILLSLVLLTGCGSKQVDNSYLRNYNNVSFFDNGTTTTEPTTQEPTTQEPTTVPTTTPVQTTTKQVKQVPVVQKTPIIGPETNAIVGEARNNVVVYKDKIDEMINLINARRAENGLYPVTYDYELSVAASVRAVEMNYTGIFEHARQCPEGYTDLNQCRTWSSVYNDLGISRRYAAENIAYGFTTIAGSMNGFMNSDSHRANILSTQPKYVGVGVAAIGNGTYYFVQLYKA